MSSYFPNFSIRPLQISDSSKILKLKHKSIQALCSEHYTSQQIEAVINSKAPEINADLMNVVNYVNSFLAKWIDPINKSSNPNAVVEHIDEKIIGYASGGYSSWFNQMIEYEMFVLPEYIRIGVGTKLLKTLEISAQNLDCQIITVGASLTGECFYKANGYKVVERTDSSFGGVRIPIVHMEKWLATPTETDKILFDLSGQVGRGIDWLTTETTVLLKEIFNE